MIPVRPRIVIISMIVFMALNLAYLPFEGIDFTFYPFPLKPSQYIWLSNYIDIIFGRFGSILYMGGIVFYYSPKLRVYVAGGFLFWILWLFDFFLTYNYPLSHCYFIPTSYSFWAVVFLLTWLWYDNYLNSKKHG